MKHKSSLMLLIHRISLLLFLAFFVCLALFGTAGLSARADSPSFVRVIHASPYVGTADVFLDGSKLLSSFGFGSITDYAPIPAGSHKVQIALVGKGVNAAALTQPLEVMPGVAYTVAAIGATPTSLSLEVFIDNNLLAPSTTKLRLYHLSPDVGPLNLTAGGNTLVSSIVYQQASQYLTMPAGSYTFNVAATTANTVLPLSVTLKANTVESAFTVGMSNGSPKLELVSAEVPGLPGLPGTGSDPHSLATNSPSQPLWLSWLSWLLGALTLGIFSTSVIIYRLDGMRSHPSLVRWWRRPWIV